MTDIVTRKWLSRVLGSGKALLTLTGPRAVTIKNGVGIVRATLLIAIACLLTILRRVDRACGEVWPTLLVRMMSVKTGFGRNLKWLPFRRKIEIFAMLSGSRLGANRTWP